MFETAFAMLFRAVQRIRDQLETADEALKPYLAEELLCLQRLGERWVERWLALEDQIQELFETHGLYDAAVGPDPPGLCPPPAPNAPSSGAFPGAAGDADPGWTVKWPAWNEAGCLADVWETEAMAVNLRKGFGYYDLKMYEHAVRFFQRVVTATGDPLARIYLASAHAALKQWPEAMREVDALRRQTDDPLLLAACAEVEADMCAARGDWAAAAKGYERIARTMPQFADAWYNLGVCLAKQGLREEAAAAFLQALKVHPGDVDAMYMLAALDVQRGALDRAEALCNRVLRRRPDHPGAYVTRAQVLAAQGRRDQAAHLLRQWLRVHPHHGPAWGCLSWLHVAAGELHMAAAVLKKRLSIQPDDNMARVQLGLVYAFAGHVGEAERVLQGVADGCPDRSLAAVALGRVFAAKGDHRGAYREFARALRDPRRPVKRVALYLWGCALCQEGRFAEAEKYLRASAVLGPRNPAILAMLARVSERLGRAVDVKLYGNASE